MKLMVVSKDSIHGFQLADGLRSVGHNVLRAWSAGEALLLARRDSPALVIVDQCYDTEPEAAKLGNYLLEQRIGIIWLGSAPESHAMVPGVPVALLSAPCDMTVALAVNALSRGNTTTELPGFTLLNR